MTFYQIYPSAFGDIAIAADEGGLVALQFVRAEQPARLGGDWLRQANSVTDAAAEQLAEYFAGTRREFDLPLNPQGTDFQRGVWEELRRIPYGETRSYRAQADALGNPRAIRAVARANGANPIAVVVPCHRVIGADGSLTGYAGGLDLKARLLTLEGASFTQQASLI